MSPVVRHRLDAVQRQANIAAAPPLCFTRHVTTGAVVLLTRGEGGYNRVETLLTPEQLNAMFCPPPTRRQIAAMEVGSLFGWDAPGAHPDHQAHVAPCGEAA